MNKLSVLEEMANFVFTSKYARYSEKAKRRETWEEAVSRVEGMHLKKFSYLSKEDKDQIIEAFNSVRAKLVVPSMRSMQFGGQSIEAHEARGYNCSVRHIDSARAFAEVFYLALCGCGIGIGLQKQFLNRLPDLVSSEDKTGIVVPYVITDTIEGWADSIEALLNCYFKNTAFTGRKIVFDYSRIRRKGSKIKTGGGKAPGYKPLKNALSKVKHLLDDLIETQSLSRLRSIDVCDIICHCSDAVLAGGVRRSALAMIFDKGDDLMMNAKTGDWFDENPQRARGNNSVLLLRNETSEQDFIDVLNKSKEFGEPGFVFANDNRQLLNPCQPSWAPILTKTGVKTLSSIREGDEIWSETGWTKVTKKWSTGIKKVYRYGTTAGCFYGTENHKLVSKGAKVEARNCETVDILTGKFDTSVSIDTQDVMDGLVFGDGTVHKASNNLVNLCIGENDSDYLSSEIKDLIVKARPGLHDYAYEVKTTICAAEIPKTFNREIPDRFIYGGRNKVCGFLRGLYTANGSICGERVTLKTSSFRVVEKVQLMLSSIGIKSYFTTNKSKTVEFSNGSYECKQSYDINITSDRQKFYSIIGFIQKYKTEKLEQILSKTSSQTGGKVSYDVISTELISEEEVFDITVDNDPHTYWTGGLNVSNCFEVNFIPETDDEVCGVQMCNLTSINGAKTVDKETFLKQAQHAALIGTLQAAYTDFKYLSRASKLITEQEALLGVSITGIMDNPQILLDKEAQKEAALLSVATNEEWAKKIKINPAARVTVIKPEGTSSIVLGASSGIHPHHARDYFRRVQCNKIDNIYQFFKIYNPEHCEESVWSANKTDDVVTFPVSISEKAMVKSDLNAIKHLEIIKSTQENWVNYGTSKSNKKPIKHSVSCTVLVEEDEWASVAKYLYDNRQSFTAVSLLPKTGDKIYQQAPMEAILSEEDKIKFNLLKNEFSKVDYSKLEELHDETKLQEEVACSGTGCELK